MRVNAVFEEISQIATRISQNAKVGFALCNDLPQKASLLALSARALLTGCRRISRSRCAPSALSSC